MKLGRACAAGAVLWAVALPLTAGTALADETPAPVETTPPAPAPSATEAPAEDPTVAPAPPRDAQVPVRPDGAPETGGGPEESGLDLAVAGGAASVAAIAAGGVVLARRRRRAGAH